MPLTVQPPLEPLVDGAGLKVALARFCEAPTVAVPEKVSFCPLMAETGVVVQAVLPVHVPPVVVLVIVMLPVVGRVWPSVNLLPVRSAKARATFPARSTGLTFRW